MSGIGFVMAPWFYWFCTRDIFRDVVGGAKVLSVLVGALIALAFLYFYPITRSRAESTRGALDARRRLATSQP